MHGLDLRIVHGTGEGLDSNLADMMDMEKEIRKLVPDVEIIHSLFDSEGTIVPPRNGRKFAIMGNSWGGAAGVAFADLNPGIDIDLLVAVNSLASPFKKPIQWPCTEWDLERRKNIKRFLFFAEGFSGMLASSKIRKPSPLREEQSATGTYTIKHFVNGREFTQNKADVALHPILNHFSTFDKHPESVAATLEEFRLLVS